MLADRNTVLLLLPEIILVAMATWIYVGGTITRSRVWWVLFSLATYVAVGLVMNRSDAATAGFDSGSLIGPLILDPLGQYLRWLALLVGMLFTLTAGKTAPRELVSETCGTLMLIVAGLMLVCRANNLVLLFLSLELISIPTYVLLYLGRAGRGASEATAKYFFLSVLSSALLLYGLSFLYGLAGVTVINGAASDEQAVLGIREALAAVAATPEAADQNLLLLLGLVFTLAGLAFRIAAVPFQFYAPDVYQGASNVTAGLLATVPKIAGIVALIRLLVMALPATSQYAWQVTMVLAVLTMTIGNVSALWQTNVRRLLAYSSIAHAGYMLIGLAVALQADQGSQLSEGVASVLLYLVVYVLAAIGIFASLTYLDAPGAAVDDIDQMAGLSRRNPAIAAALAVFLFSLAGIPPLAGFWGKLGLFAAAVRIATDVQSGASSWFLVLALLGVVNAAIAAAYYLRMVAVMFFQPPREAGPLGAGRGPAVAVSACALLVLALGLMPAVLIQSTGSAGSGIARQRPADTGTVAAVAAEPVRPDIDGRP